MPFFCEAFKPEVIHVVRLHVEREQAFAAHCGLHFRAGYALAHESQPLPWIFFQVAHADIKLDGAHEVDALEPDAVHGLATGSIIAVVMRVAQRH